MIISIRIVKMVNYAWKFRDLAVTFLCCMPRNLNLLGSNNINYLGKSMSNRTLRKYNYFGFIVLQYSILIFRDLECEADVCKNDAWKAAQHP